jgi:hypothetical protein
MTKKRPSKPAQAPHRPRSVEEIRVIFAEIDRTCGEFLPEGRPEQPPMPPPRRLFDD